MKPLAFDQFHEKYNELVNNANSAQITYVFLVRTPKADRIICTYSASYSDFLVFLKEIMYSMLRQWKLQENDRTLAMQRINTLYDFVIDLEKHTKEVYANAK